MSSENNSKTKKPYAKPEIKTEKVLEAGLGSTCNGTTSGGRKADTPSGCTASKLKT